MNLSTTLRPLSLLTKPAGGPSGPPPPPGYRYTGVRAINSTDGYLAASQLSMFEADSLTDLCLAGTMSATVAADSIYVPANLKDGNPATFFASANNQATTPGANAAVFVCDHGVGASKTVVKIGWRTRAGSPGQSPTVMEVVGRDSTGDAWTHVAFLPVQAWAGDLYREIEFTPAAAGDLPGYRYILFTVSVPQTPGAHCSVNEIEIRETVSGRSLSPYFEAVTASDFLTTGFEGWRLADGRLANNGWYSVNGSPYPKWVKIDAGPGRRFDPAEFALYSRLGEGNLGPKNFAMTGSNDDVDYVALASGVGVTGWADGVAKLYAVA